MLGKKFLERITKRIAMHVDAKKKFDKDLPLVKKKRGRPRKEK